MMRASIKAAAGAGIRYAGMQAVIASALKISVSIRSRLIIIRAEQKQIQENLDRRGLEYIMQQHRLLRQCHLRQADAALLIRTSAEAHLAMMRAPRPREP